MARIIEIVPATIKDLPFIRPLIAELMNVIEDTTGFDIEQSMENCRALLRDPEHRMLIAREKEKVLGFINFTTRELVLQTFPLGDSGTRWYC
ncbi:MAG: hypothetical protein Q8O43_05795 [Dehalococcoidia bacterium]|nr:hypothetical protein [Dehalococcoidia bacterium]